MAENDTGSGDTGTGDTGSGDTGTGDTGGTTTDDISLEIHHVNVTNGDGSIILVKRGDEIIKKVLIDITGLNQGPRLMKAYWSQYGLDAAPFDYLIVSHYHEDHMTGIIKVQPAFLKYIDIGGYWQSTGTYEPLHPSHETSDAFKKYAAYIRQKTGTNDEKNLPPGGDIYREKLPFIEKANYEEVKVDDVETMQWKGSDDDKKPHEIILYQNPDDDTDKITLTCYAADGIVAGVTDVMTEQSVEKQAAAGNKPASSVASPNNYSLAFLLAWAKHDFLYYTAGDLSGDPTLQHYLNIEKPLVDYLKSSGVITDGQKLSAYKADHHGSTYNTYGPYEEDGHDIPGFLDELSPTTVIVPCNRKLGAPGGDFFERVQSWGTAKNATIMSDGGGEIDKACIYFVNLCVYLKRQRYRGTTYDDVEKLVNSDDLPSNLVKWTDTDAEDDEDPPTEPNTNPIMNTRLVQQNAGNKDNTPCAICIRVPSTGPDTNDDLPSTITCTKIPKTNHDIWILSASYTLPEGKNGPSQNNDFFKFPQFFYSPRHPITGIDTITDLLREQSNFVWQGRNDKDNADRVKNNLPKLMAWLDDYLVASKRKYDKTIEDQFIEALSNCVSEKLDAIYRVTEMDGQIEYILLPQELLPMSPSEQKTLFNFIFADQRGLHFALKVVTPSVKIYVDPNAPKSNESKRERVSLSPRVRKKPKRFLD